MIVLAIIGGIALGALLLVGLLFLFLSTLKPGDVP